jgi:hypothetical protein
LVSAIVCAPPNVSNDTAAVVEDDTDVDDDDIAADVADGGRRIGTGRHSHTPGRRL